ncbi:MAG TPA: hypothetical protein VG603_10025 [Chitinophagales bacterium]|nr:hypothetical protein [Chitinophagales bacterium]
MKKFIQRFYTPFILAFAALLVLPACHYSTEYKQADTHDRFIISVPPWTKPEEKLKPGAPFQYANRYRNFYAIGEVVAKTDSDKLGSLMNTNLNVLRKSLTKPVVTDSNTVTIGGLKGIRCEIYGKMKDEPIYFSEVLLTGKDSTYHLSVWTRGEDRKLRYKDDIDKILNSFKEKE